ncbi:transposase [Thiorhodospira sibirica]|uniref:transposase n=1 Tax=Thiorhodospira sibirica TaxID=154347 RepID=UPI00022C33FF|nr:transposase [Thiorhodospira sibirica]
MIRALFERCLDPVKLDAWFDANSEQQYTRNLLFSSLFRLMTKVVLRQQTSIYAAYPADKESIPVSVTSVYNKLNGLSIETSAQWVTYGAEQASALIDELDGAREPLLPGFRVKVLDGNCLGAREHRLKETRHHKAAPLPGKTLAVFDPAKELIIALYPCEDAYTQERALLGAGLADVEPDDLWLADRNFCTHGFLRGVADRGGYFLIRAHEQVRFDPLEPMREIGQTETGSVAEQWVELTGKEGRRVRLRRIRIRLNEPTRDGDDRIDLFTTVPAQSADAVYLADLYLERWCVETAFLHLTKALRCEVDTLAHPPAALFAFACAVITYNVLSVAKAALRVAHGEEADNLSGYYMARHISNTAESLCEIVDSEDWTVFHTLAVVDFAAWLLAQAERTKLSRYHKAKRGPKKPAPQRSHDRTKPHVSVARLLAAREKKSP